MKTILNIVILLALIFICTLWGIICPKNCPTSNNDAIQAMHYIWYTIVMFTWATSPGWILFIGIILFKQTKK
jgi:hypothetical protein